MDGREHSSCSFTEAPETVFVGGMPLWSLGKWTSNADLNAVRLTVTWRDEQSSKGERYSYDQIQK